MLETSLMDEADGNRESLKILINALQDLVQSLVCDENTHGNVQGTNADGEEVARFTWTTFHSTFRSLVTLSDSPHWAVFHARCIDRIFYICNGLIDSSDASDQKIMISFIGKKLRVCIRTIRVSRNLTKYIRDAEFDTGLLKSLVSFADSLLGFLRTSMELVNFDIMAENSFGSLILLALEEFLALCRLLFCNSYVFLNIQAWIISSIFENMGTSFWARSEHSQIDIPLACFPHSVTLTLKLIDDITKQTDHFVDWKDLSMKENEGSECLEFKPPYCSVHNGNISLLKKYTVKELLQIIFPLNKQWVNNLLHLVSFLHYEGIKLGPKLKSNSSEILKGKCVAELENVSVPEEDALCGNLFSESVHSIGCSDGSDPLSSIGTLVLCNENMYIHAVTELLSFIKGCVFSPERYLFLYQDGCKKLTFDNLSVLLSILNCRACHDKLNPVRSDTDTNVFRGMGLVHDLCFDILYNLLKFHGFSGPLEEYLVDEILKIENGVFIYNDITLSLLARALICRGSKEGQQLRNKVIHGFVDYIVKKSDSMVSDYPTLKVIVEIIPSLLHMEIIVMALHLSSPFERASFESYILSSMKKMSLPSPGCSSLQLSCWALFTSRLVVAHRYLIFFTQNTPSLLLLDLKSRLNEFPTFHFDNTGHCLFSWTSVTAKTFLGAWVSDDPLINTLLYQFVDVEIINSPLNMNGTSKHELLELYTTFSKLWNGRKAGSVEDLLIERYVFSLSWDFIILNQETEHSFHHIREGMDIVFHLSSHLLAHRRRNDMGSITFSDVVCLFKHLHDILSDNMREINFDSFRAGFCISLLLFVINSGVVEYCTKNPSLSTDVGFSEEDNHHGSSQNLVCEMFEGGNFEVLIKLLYSLLEKYMKLYQTSFVYSIDSDIHSNKAFSLSLLKHTEFDKTMQAEILCKIVENNWQVESLCSIFFKIEEIIRIGVLRFPSKLFSECMLHGFPSLFKTSSGVFVSTVLNIKRTINTLYVILKAIASKGTFCSDFGIHSQVLDTLMDVKSDRVLESLGGECSFIFCCLIGGSEKLCYSYLFTLKQMEKFLIHFEACQEFGGVVHGFVVTKIFNIMETLFKDPSMREVLDIFLGVESGEKNNELYGSQRGDLQVIFDCLNKQLTESLNIKILNFFVSLLSGERYHQLKHKIQKKFLAMELVDLSIWLKERLLHDTITVESSTEFNSEKGSSNPLRESTVHFISCILSTPDMESAMLHYHLFSAFMILLDTAFMQFDIHTVKAYFTIVLQFAKKEHLVKLLINKIFSLTERLNGVDERPLQGLKFLYNFITTALTDCLTCKSGFEKLSLRSCSSDSLGLGFQASRSESSRKSSETLVLSTNQEGAITSSECDVVFFDDDDDYGTSDGELRGLDKDEDDVSNNERALASKLCTFTASGRSFMEQHWYFCYTCDLTVSKGCCSVCAKVCHRGHRVAYSRSSRFFCDCGAGGARGSSCQCMQPRVFSGSNTSVTQSISNFESLNVSEEVYQLPETDSDIDEETCTDSLTSAKLVFPKEFQDGLLMLLKEVDAEGSVLKLCSSILSSIMNKKEAGVLQDKNVVIGEHKVVSHGFDLLNLIKAYKNGFIDLKVKADYTSGKELKCHPATGSLVKSLLSVSSRGRLAVGEGDKVTLFDMSQLIGQQSTISSVSADKTNTKPLSKNFVRFEIVQLIFNPMIESYLAVAGYEDCHILTLSSRGEVTDRLPIELSLQGDYIRFIEWVPGTQTELMVVTNKDVKIYDLSLDNISPMHCLTVPDETIVDATFASSSLCRLFVVMLTDMGCLFKFELKSDSTMGMHHLKETILIKNGNKPEGGLSIHFSEYFKLLFISYRDGSTLVGRLNPSATCITDVSPIYEVDQDTGILPAGLHHWKELVYGGSLFACYSSVKSNSAFVLSFGTNEVYTQNIKKTVVTTSVSVGISAYRLLSKDKVQIVLLQDDGSLHIYSHSPVGIDGEMKSASDKVKEIRSRLLSNEFVGKNPEFPLDFFERTVCITADVKMGSESIRNGDTGVKQRLSSDDGFLESPNANGFKITISNSNPDIVMVGFRIHVGNTSSNNIPSDISIFQRAIKLDEGMQAWYDIPFTINESLLADEEFTISIGPAFSPSSLSRIDSLEVYGRTKDEFGWREKVDAVFGVDARLFACNVSVTNLKRKRFSVQSAPIDEQVLADGLKLLSRFYLLSRVHGVFKPDEGKTELSKFKCTDLLELIFQSDREPLLQASACSILHSLFPNREIYYQVKDVLRLFGVVKSSTVVKSKLNAGYITIQSAVEELTIQIHAVSKIALHRRSNLAKFLEMNGPQVVEGLLEILFEIVRMDQVESQTLNSLVIQSVDLIFSYAQCLALHAKESDQQSIASAVCSLKKLLFSDNTVVQSSCSLAIASRLLQVPFPKQATLATHGAPDRRVPISGPSETMGENGQPMIEEEDTSTSSVQYCCDGCSTVPILRRRWHCTVCPDFDLCETCHEVLDPHQLPEPHSRRHPMSAIPIEMDSVADNQDIHFPNNDMNMSNIPPPAPDTANVPNTNTLHVLDPTEIRDFPSNVSDTGLFSASKQALNSLVLAQLLEQMKGWMDATTGIRAIPIMQLFYRLSTVYGGHFIDMSRLDGVDMEKVIQWFLEEINISNPFVPHSRSLFGEVVILIFMFFTLMLRNHSVSEPVASRLTASVHSQEKGVSLSTSAGQGAGGAFYDCAEKVDSASRFIKTCGCLRNQAFVNYLVDILQKLIHIFKSPSILETLNGPGSSPGCGSLLTVWKELPSGIFSPFFSDSYAKSRWDIFADYHRLLLENTFRLLYSLVRPERHDKNGEKEKIHKSTNCKDLKLDGFHDVFCFYINSPHTSFVRRYARRLFLHLCGSKTQYYSIRDSWQFSTENSKLCKYVKKSGGVQAPVSYERGVKIVKCLSSMAEVAATRPCNWQRYCLRHHEMLPFLLSAVFHFEDVSVIQALGLLNLAFYTGKDTFHFTFQKTGAGEVVGVGGEAINKSGSQSSDSKKRKTEVGTESGSDKVSVDMESAVDVFTDEGVNQFIDRFLLESNSGSVRTEAKFILHGAFHHGAQSSKESLLLSLLKKIHLLPRYGQNIVEYTELMTLLFGKVLDPSQKQVNSELLDRCLTHDFINCIFGNLRAQNKLLANHPNSRIYNTLSGLIELEGFYLESEPCVSCTSPDLPYSKTKLEALKSETKFTDNRIIVKCSGNYTIQSVTMTVHDARKSKSVKTVNLYYNNIPVADLSELKNNWPMWKRAKSCSLLLNQADMKAEFPIPITACNFMIELDSFYENFQALSLEPLQCPRCSRPVTDKHGNCGNCHENAYQCRQCRNINYENLNSFLCNECGYSKYGRFEFSFMAKPSFNFDNMESDEDMRKGLAAIECESENVHRKYQQLLGFKKPILKIVSSIGESDTDSQQKDSVQQIMVSLSGPSCKINRKIALLGVLYGEKCKTAFDSVSKSIQTLQGLRKVLVNYLNKKPSFGLINLSNFAVSQSPRSCYGCVSTFVAQCLDLLQILSKHPNSKKRFVAAGVVSELFENNIHQGPKTTRLQARAVLCAFSEGDQSAVAELNNLIQKKILYCIEHHHSVDIPTATREELSLLSEVSSLNDDFWESRLRVVFRLFFTAIKVGAQHPVISEYVVLPCLRIILRACTLPKVETVEREHEIGIYGGMTQPSCGNRSGSPKGPVIGGVDNNMSLLVPLGSNFTSSGGDDVDLLSYSEWEKGGTYVDFVRRQYRVSHVVKGVTPQISIRRHGYLDLKYALKWKRTTWRRRSKGGAPTLELGTWVKELVMCRCSQSVRLEMCMFVSLLCSHSLSRKLRLLDLLMNLLPDTLTLGETAAEYFDLVLRIIDSEDACLFLTVRGHLTILCSLITKEVDSVALLEKTMRIDISQGFTLHKLIILLGKFLDVPNIRARFMRDNMLFKIFDAFIIIQGLIVQKTKLINDCNQILKDLFDSLLLESSGNKRQFIGACIHGLRTHGEAHIGRNSMFILDHICNLICPSKPEPVYLLILNKSHTQEEFIRGSMTKNPYTSVDIGPLMRDVKNKICCQLELLGLLEDDYGMELLVAGNIISLDLSISQVYEQVWKKSNLLSSSIFSNASLHSSTSTSRDYPPMPVTYRLQGLDGEATEPMIKELDEDRDECKDPEVEFAIAATVREFGGLEIILGMIQRLQDNLGSNQEQLLSVLNLLMHCCKIRENRQALLNLSALGLLLETARRAFYVEAMELAESILLVVESLTLEANDSESIFITPYSNSISSVPCEDAASGEHAKKIILMFLERVCHPPVRLGKSSKQQRNTEMVTRILPYLTYGEPAAMEALISHFEPYLRDWGAIDRLLKPHGDGSEEEAAAHQRFALESFVRMSESLKTTSCGERLKDIILDKGITERAVRHLRESFGAGSGKPSLKSSVEWAAGLKLPSVPLILSMLRGLSLGHVPTQLSVDKGGVLPLLHALESVPGVDEIGAKAENLLDTLSGDNGFLREKVQMLRRSTRDEMRCRALKKREEMLQGMGMREEGGSGKGGRIVVMKNVIQGMEEVEEEEEEGISCMVCREGYRLRPADILGVYSYSKRVNLGVPGGGGGGGGRGECVITTVTHFNVIHFQCHVEAKRADSALKTPKKEWEGATLRNNETLCNSIFPLWSPSLPLPLYTRSLDLYWDNLSSLGHVDGSRLRLLTYDIVLLLARFATGASFSVDSKGGGRESNACLLPFMVQMGHLLGEQGNPPLRTSLGSSIDRYLSAGGGTEETVQLMMVNSILGESYEKWEEHRPGFLRRGIWHAYMQKVKGAAAEDMVGVVRPILVYTGVVERVQKHFKRGGRRAWEDVMKERVGEVKEMLAFSRDIVVWLEAVMKETNVDKLFSDVGVIGDVSAAGFSHSLDFLTACIPHEN